MAYKSSGRGGSPVYWIVGHTAEGARTKENLGAYFYRPDIAASSHVGIDGSGIVQYVPYDRAAWTLRAGNPVSENAELCGFAKWTREQWLSTGTIDGCVNPRQMLRNFAAWARGRCLARGIPLRKLTVTQTANRTAGIIHHADYTAATGDGTHWDMGVGVPWDIVMADVLGTPDPPIGKVEDMSVMYIRGNSTVLDEKGVPYGYRVFKVEFTGRFLEGAVRTLILNQSEPSYRLWLATGNAVKVVDQAIVDAIPNKEIV